MNKGSLNCLNLCFWNLLDISLVTYQTKNLLKSEKSNSHTRDKKGLLRVPVHTLHIPTMSCTDNQQSHHSLHHIDLFEAQYSCGSLRFYYYDLGQDDSTLNIFQSYNAIHSCSKSDETWNNCSSSLKAKFSVKIFVPANDLSSWQRAKSHTLTVVSSEQEQNLRSVLEKLKQQQSRISSIKLIGTHWAFEPAPMKEQLKSVEENIYHHAEKL